MVQERYKKENRTSIFFTMEIPKAEKDVTTNRSIASSQQFENSKLLTKHQQFLSASKSMQSTNIEEEKSWKTA